MTYQNYHRHSYYSNVLVPDVVVSNEDFAIRAVELGHKILSGVEHGWCGRSIEGYELAKKHDLKFVFGTEAYIVKDRLEKDATNAHIIVLAKSELGRRKINNIMSEANITGFYYRPRIDLDLLLSLPKNDVWVTSACVGGLWKYEDADEMMIRISEYFGRNFFLEVQDHNTDSQKELNKRIIELSNQYNIPIIFGCDSHYITRDQSKNRDDYLLSKHIVYEDEQGWYMDYASDETVVDRFQNQNVLTNAQIKEAMNNTNVLLEVEDYNAKVYQKTSKIPSLFPNDSQEEKDQILKDHVFAMWDIEKFKVPKNRWKEYEKEINKELDIIIDTHMADYFLLDYFVVKEGKELGGAITMTGRGSAPSFYICKLLGLTTIDRIASSVKLFPERFITKERILEAHTLPDIDLNLGTVEIFAQAQKNVLGENHSYPMLAYGTLRPKAAWKLYARAKNIEFSVANEVSEQIDKYEMFIKHVSEDEKDIYNELDFIDPEYRSMYTDSKDYLGIVSDFKIHPCAYLLYDGDIREEIGLIKIKDHLCCCMDGLWGEQYSFLKNDLLKVSVVDLIYKVYRRIGIEPHPFPELIELCKNDQTVWDIYKNAWTMGINQVEQKSTSGRVAKYAPRNISELSAFVAAVRPGFQSNYKQFEAREPFSYGIPSLDKLIQTDEFPQSYMLYQENAMQVMAYAGIPVSQTYEIVKNIAKKRVDKVLKNKEVFISGMTKRLMKEEGRDKEEAESVANQTWQIIEDSSRYSFNASHSYSVGGDSLYGAYLKSHYPLEFYEVFLNLLEADGDKDRLNNAKEEAKRAFKINFPPYRFGQDNRSITLNKEKWEISSSLASIKGFNSEIGNDMWELSQNKYEDFVEFMIALEESGKNSKKIEDLIKIGYFEMFGNNKKLLSFYKEFMEGKSRYSKTHTDKTKEKRIAELKEFFASLPNERLPMWDQINAENDILGYIQATYPVDRRYIYVMSIDEKFAPRVESYCLANGKRASLKVQKKLFENKMFRGGEILFVKSFKEKPAVKFIDGHYVDDENGETCWWIENYEIVNDSQFDKIVG
jgi:DNA polymerase III alpha subunit